MNPSRIALVTGAANGIGLASSQALLRAGHPVRRLGTPSEVASAIVYLVSEDAAFINGALLDLNGSYMP